MKNIAISLSNGNAEARNVLTGFVTAKGWPYWHWIDDLWIVQVPSDMTPKSVYAQLEAIPVLAKATILVFVLNGDVVHWGRADKAAWDWLAHIGRAG